MKPPKDELEKYQAYYKSDTDFAAFARLLQSKWRAKKGYPIGKLGNYLETDFAKVSQSNYLTDNIKKLVENEVRNSKTNGNLISEPRIWDNLLSSQPLCFNLFGELHFDLELATKFFQTLFPQKIKEVIRIKFEYSPARNDKNYTDDRSAFDVFIEYHNEQEETGFIGIEVKYAENLNDKPATHKEIYDNIANKSGLFKPTSLLNLQSKPLQQIWRDHLLSIAMQKDYKEGIFVFLYPKQNDACQKAVKSYVAQLKSEEEEINGFYPRYLEDFVQTLADIHATEWTEELKERYFGA
jgi:hypothetical protein